MIVQENKVGPLSQHASLLRNPQFGGRGAPESGVANWGCEHPEVTHRTSSTTKQQPFLTVVDPRLLNRSREQTWCRVLGSRHEVTPGVKQRTKIVRAQLSRKVVGKRRGQAEGPERLSSTM